MPTSDFQPWGRIPDWLTPFPRTDTIPAGEIIITVGTHSITVGTHSEGFTHVERRHGNNIRKLHPGLSLEDYLRDVSRHFQRAYLQDDGSIWIFRRNGVTKCAVVAPLTLRGILHYKLITAYPIPREPTPARLARRGAARLNYL